MHEIWHISKLLTTIHKSICVWVQGKPFGEERKHHRDRQSAISALLEQTQTNECVYRWVGIGVLFTILMTSISLKMLPALHYAELSEVFPRLLYSTVRLLVQHTISLQFHTRRQMDVVCSSLTGDRNVRAIERALFKYYWHKYESYEQYRVRLNIDWISTHSR